MGEVRDEETSRMESQLGRNASAPLHHLATDTAPHLWGQGAERCRMPDLRDEEGHSARVLQVRARWMADRGDELAGELEGAADE